MADHVSNHGAGAGRSTTASRVAALSFPPALDGHKKVHSGSAFSRGHHVHVVSNQPDKGFLTVTPFGLLTLRLPVDWRRFCRRPFPHSHRPGFPPSRRRAFRGLSLIPGFRGARQSIRATGSSRSRAHSLPAKQLSQSLAHRKHHHRLSSSLVLVGIDPNEIGLTHAQAFFAPGAKAND